MFSVFRSVSVILDVMKMENQIIEDVLCVDDNIKVQKRSSGLFDKYFVPPSPPGPNTKVEKRKSGLFGREDMLSGADTVGHCKPRVTYGGSMVARVEGKCNIRDCEKETVYVKGKMEVYENAKETRKKEKKNAKSNKKKKADTDTESNGKKKCHAESNEKKVAYMETKEQESISSKRTIFDDNEYVCPICFHEFEATYRTPDKCTVCRHTYCKPCRNRLKSCPFCRAPLVTETSSLV